MTEAWGVRSDLTPAKTLPLAVEGPEARFLGSVTSWKLLKVTKKTTPMLAAIELNV